LAPHAVCHWLLVHVTPSGSWWQVLQPWWVWHIQLCGCTNFFYLKLRICAEHVCVRVYVWKYDWFAALMFCTQVLWIRLLWQLANRRQLPIRLLLVRRKRSKVVECPLVSCSHLGQQVLQQRRRQSGRHWQSSTHRSLYHRSTAITHSCEVDSMLLLLQLLCISHVYSCVVNGDISLITGLCYVSPVNRGSTLLFCLLF